MKDLDYPALYLAANSASINNQTTYLKSIKYYLILLIVAAGFSIYAGDSKVAAIIAATLFLVTLFLSILTATKKNDRIWYNGRAVAESVKTITWRYMMKAEPFDKSDLKVVNSEFVSALKEILKQNKELGQYLGDDDCTKETITDKMYSVRSSSTKERLSFYISNRIDEQRRWYAKKTKYNKNMSWYWFLSIVALQTLALICVSLKVVYPTIKFLPTELFVVSASSILTWMQIKRFPRIIYFIFVNSLRNWINKNFNFTY